MIPTATLSRIWGIEERTSPDGRGAVAVSTDGTRRSMLTRRWTPGPLMAWLMLNPSKADEATDDATITRCMKRARPLLGFGGIVVVNLFSLRATDPRELVKHPDPVGPGNDLFIIETCQAAGLVVVAWGAHGRHLGRARDVAAMLAQARISPYCLGVTATGQPRHPGRLSYSTTLRPYAAGDVR